MPIFLGVPFISNRSYLSEVPPAKATEPSPPRLSNPVFSWARRAYDAVLLSRSPKPEVESDDEFIDFKFNPDKDPTVMPRIPENLERWARNPEPTGVIRPVKPRTFRFRGDF